MNKFKLRPATVSAIQWQPGVFVPLAIESPSGAVYVNTVSGKVALLPGDYVIIGAPGGHQIMHSDDFEAKYEPVAVVKKAEAKPAKKAEPAKKVVKKKATKKATKK